MVRIGKLGIAFLVLSLEFWTTASAQEQWEFCRAGVERAPDVKISAGPDFTGHSGGGFHEGDLYFIPKCIYRRDCTIICRVEAAATVLENSVDLGIDGHAKGQEFKHGTGSGSRGASVSCTAGAAVAVNSCFLGLCDVDIEWDLGLAGVTINSQHVWSYGDSYTHTCAPPTPAPGPDPRDPRGPNPNRCRFCGTGRVCGPWYSVCSGWEAGKGSGDDGCTEWRRDCVDVERWCCGHFGASLSSESQSFDASSLSTEDPTFGASSSLTQEQSADEEWLCGDWVEETICERGSPCCLNPQQFPSGPTCASAGLFAESQEARCIESCGGPCEPVSLVKGDCGGEPCDQTLCWQCSSNPTCTPGVPEFTVSSTTAEVGEEITFRAEADSIQEPPTPLWDLGNGVSLTGNTVSYAYPAPGTYSVRLSASNAVCGSVRVSARQTLTIRDSGPSCGDLGGTYCSQSGSCPSGYDSLGNSYDCSPCCKPRPQPSCGAMGGSYCSQSGSCPSGYDSLGMSSDCNPCCKQNPRPSCGAMGGDYCSQTVSCPANYTSLGASSDCTRCCKYEPPPSCGAMGGDYCSQSASCPAGYRSLGASSDCVRCCVSEGEMY